MGPERPLYAISDQVEYWVTGIALLCAVGSLALCMHLARSQRSLVPMYLFAGGVLAVFCEPFVNSLGLAMFPERDQIPWITALGRRIPMFIGLMYMFFIAPATLYLWHRFDRGLTRRAYWVLCGQLLTGVLGYEVAQRQFDLWRFYGEQPGRIFEVPLWWVFANAQCVVGTAVLLRFVVRLLPAGRRFVLVALIPPMFLAVDAAGMFVGAAGVLSSSSAAVTVPATTASMGVCLLLLWLYSRAVCSSDAPIHTSRSEPVPHARIPEARG